MKILQITPRYYPSLGGVEETVRLISEGMVTNFGHQVKVLTSDVDSDGSKSLNGVLVQRLTTVPFLRKGPYLPITLTILPHLLSDESDLWHLHANKRFGTDLAAVILKMKPKPYLFSPYAGMFGTHFWGRWHNQTIGRLAFQAKTVIAITHYEKNLLEKNGVRARHFEIIPPTGIKVSDYQKASGEIRKKYSLEKNKIILAVGRLAPHKGIDTLINATPLLIRRIPEARVLIVGPDFGEREKLQALAKSLGVEGQVIFAGSLPRDEVLACYKDADVFCFPSRNEAFGVVLVEAMAAGLPVVAANNSAIPEVCQNEETGLLFETESPEDLAAKVQLILEETRLRQSLINNAGAYVAENYRLDKVLERYNRVYLEALR